MTNDVVTNATLVFFGGTGDLAGRKLIPALFNNWQQKRLRDCLIVGIGRRAKDRDEYLQLLDGKVGVAQTDPADWKEFTKQLDYHQGEIRTEEDFKSLRAKLESLEKERGLPGKRLFYYAVGPQWFAPITENLAASGLLEKQGPDYKGPWTRLVIEKPYGTDLASAKELDRRILACADEEQVYRIDHYLGKETVQNLLAFRFANGLFEPVWNQKYIDSVQITVSESLGIGNRGDYYEKAGAMRDMVINHMMQLVCLTAMEPPARMNAKSIRDEKVKVLQAVRVPQSLSEVEQSTVRGQYGPGTINGESVPGYREEGDTDPNSTTPSFVALRLQIDTWRWAHVPFLLRHGKRMAKRGTEIAIQFRTPPLSLFRGHEICGHCSNMLVLRIQPKEGITLYFGAKKPGAGMSISTVSMDFEYEREFHESIPEAYQRLLLDALVGDPTLFTRSDEVRAQWTWADAILSAWDEIPPPKYPNYPAGGWGPSAAESLFPQGDEIPSGSCPVGWRRW
ncbi:Glucose-6-phosphate 1-dehydrogenase [Planctomycetes bacterium Pan216]|uniref:Glucose-6-phosphate 1-dehydrogenase n=1 Tax=Kolteria novifilia TaxID=2527975 RepID=A0A518BAJ0_9BACT|nr:Glucose-6-phosphate 1-dehydrogenase [Planctomycetes bacterium Pan216]